ncbi:hypothetical protein EXIGLDRAFT_830356 [Exidia glandulosa HHB12029]|uniref:Uncharacterized protein n=1 Tax=Exidia glandulosa HHB12029 TaxID=1314781 RepID=A0A165NLJ9_EXIGL|nr:hypothetical protein EXIGLDRAFT_830356 [Exidia glandulosa HHB12029]
MPPRLDAVASISRTSGTDASGDALRNPQFQEEYAQVLATKVAAHWKRFPSPVGSNSHVVPSNDEQLECDSLLIAFRKLREGVLSSRREDAFAIHVYESSFLLSVLFRSPAHATASLAHLTHVLYTKQPRTATVTDLVATAGMLHTLLHLEHPAEFMNRLHHTSPFLSPETKLWLSRLSRYKRTDNFAAARLHMSPDRLPAVLTSDATVEGQLILYGGRTDVGKCAVQRLISLIAADMGTRAWNVLRAAYREAVVQESADWLAQNLALDRTELDVWVKDKEQKGELREAETNGRVRWTFVKART